MRTNLRRFTVPAAGLAVALALTGCSQSSDSDSDSASDSGSDNEAASFFSVDDCTDPDAATAEIDGDIKVGYTLPLSGPVAGPVEISIAGYEARINAWNEAGGVDGHKIEIVYKDDAFAPDKAKANAVDLMQNDDVDVLTTFGSGQVAAFADDQNAACVPLLYPSATNPDYYDIAEYPWTVQFLPRADREAKFNVAAIQQQMGDGDYTVGIAANETASGQTNAENFKAAAEEAGLDIAVEVADTDATAAATELKSAGVDVVFHAGLTGTCAALSTAMDRIGFKPEMTVRISSCASAAEFIAAGDAAEGDELPLFAKNPSDPGADSDEGIQQYMEEMDAAGKTDTAGNTVTVAGWAQADMLIHTIEQAAASDDGLTRASIITAARNLDYTSPMFINGLSWISTPEALTGVSGFDMGVWSVKDQTFVPAGDPLQID